MCKKKNLKARVAKSEAGHIVMLGCCTKCEVAVTGYFSTEEPAMANRDIIAEDEELQREFFPLAVSDAEYKLPC